MQGDGVTGQEPWRRRGRPIALCALAAVILLWIVVGNASYTSGQFTDFETDTSEAIWMTTHPADIKIVKTTDAAGFFEFSSDIPGCPSSFSFTFAEAGTQEWLCNPVDAGSYEVTETSVGWDVAIECVESDTSNSDDDSPPTASIVLEEFEKVVCTFTNEVINTGTLSVDLDYSDDSATGLAVNVSCSAGASPETDGLTAYDPTAADFTIVDMPIGGTACNATLGAPPSSGYEIDDTECQGVILTPVAPAAACTIELTKLGSITIVQGTDTGGSVTFDASPNFGACLPIELDGGGANSTSCGDLTPNVYEIVQDVPLGWESVQVDCGTPASDITPIASNTGVSIELVAGEDVTCTFTNEPI